jgi:hypothetical protein
VESVTTGNNFFLKTTNKNVNNKRGPATEAKKITLTDHTELYVKQELLVQPSTYATPQHD